MIKSIPRKYDAIGSVKNRRTSKGRKKKLRRMNKADSADGWQRKKSNTLAPQHKTSKTILKDTLNDYI